MEALSISIVLNNFFPYFEENSGSVYSSPLQMDCISLTCFAARLFNLRFLKCFSIRFTMSFALVSLTTKSPIFISSVSPYFLLNFCKFSLNTKEPSIVHFLSYFNCNSKFLALLMIASFATSSASSLFNSWFFRFFLKSFWFVSSLIISFNSFWFIGKVVLSTVSLIILRIWSTFRRG